MVILVFIFSHNPQSFVLLARHKSIHSLCACVLVEGQTSVTAAADVVERPPQLLYP